MLDESYQSVQTLTHQIPTDENLDTEEWFRVWLHEEISLQHEGIQTLACEPRNRW